MLNSSEILNITSNLDPRTVTLSEDEVAKICNSSAISQHIMQINPRLEFMCDPFGHDYSRLVFFKDNLKYSILKLDPSAEEIFNSHKMIPPCLSSTVHRSLCISKIIPEAYSSEWLFNFCIIDNQIIIYDEEIYVGFLKYNIDDLPDFIHYYASKALGSAFQFYAFDDDYVMCNIGNNIVKLMYRDIIPMFEAKTH